MGLRGFEGGGEGREGKIGREVRRRGQGFHGRVERQVDRRRISKVLYVYPDFWFDTYLEIVVFASKGNDLCRSRRSIDIRIYSQLRTIHTDDVWPQWQTEY